jgi:predicted CXXCH cytochrome family protein
VCLALAGCGPEEEPEAPAPAEAPVAAPAADTTAGGYLDPDVRPTEPVEPGSCMTGECHRERRRAAYLHKPVMEVACDACHMPEQPGHKFPIRQEGAELCTVCHPSTALGAHTHQVVEQEGCLPCHDPHASNARWLLVDMSAELLCQRCHWVERKSQRHDLFASGACTACHDPHVADNRSLLIGGDGKDHCMACHSHRELQIKDANQIHKPVAAIDGEPVPEVEGMTMRGGCLDCHTHHTADHEDLLVSGVYDLCVTCHPAIRDALSDLDLPHGAVFTGRSCANCHESHAGAEPFLLRGEERELCLACHHKPQEGRDGRVIPGMQRELVSSRFLHGPIKVGNCNECHLTHASRYATLLRDRFPEEFYASFDLGNYALCFTCHSEVSVLNERSAAFTGFREGNENLHFVHVNRPDKGRTCRTCHEIHGSDLSKHMASRVPFEGGGWSMPIGFRATPTGGRCSPGCHEPREYNRLVTGVGGRPEVDLGTGEEQGR